ncbi:hypothetical protein [uncultured Deinococcus sp.]|uniref:hypothetical protein n=1 Tax=uncultured Deinococcus sp. TaxID=158789 RepID=UPI0037480923
MSGPQQQDGRGVGVERPILFSGPMIHALLDGSKTQTRRVVKLPKWIASEEHGQAMQALAKHPAGVSMRGPCDGLRTFLCPYGKVGDRLWVRETWNFSDASTLSEPKAIYRAGDERSISDPNWRPSIFMPRWASRILLEITDVRVERLQAISEKDARAEGAAAEFEVNVAEFVHGRKLPASTHYLGFKHLWKEINGRESWDANPWVWAVSFRLIAPAPAPAPAKEGETGYE